MKYLKKEIGRSGVAALNKSIINLTKMYTEFFEVLNNRCILGDITPQEFFDKQEELASIIRELEKLKNQEAPKNVGKHLSIEDRNQLRDDYQSGNYTKTELSKIYNITERRVRQTINSERELSIKIDID